MKEIKEKSSIVNPRLSDATRRIPQTIQRVAREISTNNDPDRNKCDTPENEAIDCVQAGTLQATSYVDSGLRISRNKINNFALHSRKNSFNKNQATNRTIRYQFSRFKITRKFTPWSQHVVRSYSPITTSKLITRRYAHVIEMGKDISKTIVQGLHTADRSIIATAQVALASFRGIGSLIAAGGWIAVIVIVVFAIVGWTVMSPTSILAGGFSEENPDRTVYTVLDELAEEVNARIKGIIDQEGDGCNVSIDYVDGNNDVLGQVGPQIMAIYSVQVSVDPDNPSEVATLDGRKETILRAIFWATVLISYDINESTYIDKYGFKQLDRNLELTVDCLSLEEVIDKLNFDYEQKLVAIEIIKELSLIIEAKAVSPSGQQNMTA